VVETEFLVETTRTCHC